MALDTGGLLRKMFPGIGVEGAGDPTKPLEPGAEPNPDPHLAKPGDPPKDPQAPGKSPDPVDPLAQFSKIFDNKPPVEPGKEDIPLSVAGILTEETLSKLTENLDFNSFLTEKTREALAGGEDPKAIFNAFNEIALGSYRTAMTHSSKLSEQIMEDRLGRLEAGLGEKINAHHIQSEISANEIINKSPVLKAGISLIAENLRQTQPDASPEWITKTATEFFMESAKVLNSGEGNSNPPGPGGGDPAPSGEAGTDWMDFALGDENPGGEPPTN